MGEKERARGLAQRLVRRRAGIPPDRYTRDYFLSDRCEGFRQYREGAALSDVKRRLVEKVDPRAGERVLELGCGRGEVLRACVERGARVVGIDYAAEAVRLTRETAPEAPVVRADAGRLPFRTGAFSAVFLGDVLEHLTLAQAEAMLGESHRVLAHEGRLVVHTSPNVLFIRLVFPWVLALLLVTGRWGLFRTFVAQYRTIREFHVREYSAGRLRRLFRRSPFLWFDVVCDRDLLRGGKSRYTETLAASSFVRAVAAVASREPWVRIFSNDLWVVAKKAHHVAG